MPRSRGRLGFTLVELLVVIAIIGVLVALLLPAVQAAREAARRAQCKSQLKQQALAVLNFESANKRFPAGSTANQAGHNGTYSSTWTVDILPFMEQAPLHKLWDPKTDFTHANNKALRETIVPAFLCPSDIELGELMQPESGDTAISSGAFFAPGSYRAMSGWSPGQNGDTFFDNISYSKATHETALPLWTRGPLYAVSTASVDRKLEPVAMKEIIDGTSNTLMIGEYHTISRPVPTSTVSRRTLWAYAYTSYNQSSAVPESRCLIPDYVTCFGMPGAGVENCKRAFASLHAGNLINFANCDGSVTEISQDIDIDFWADLGTISSEGARLGAPGRRE
jgi:prepilin-type N-terminal cleavage/methylation domain-containing protein